MQPPAAVAPPLVYPTLNTLLVTCHLDVMYSLSTALIPEEAISPQTVGATGHVTVSSSIQITMTDGAINATVPICSSMQPVQNCGAITTIQPTKSDGANVTTKTVPVSSGTLLATNPPSDGTTTTTGTLPVSSSTQPTPPPSDTILVIIVVAVVIILVVIVVGVVILVVLRVKKGKQRLEINKLQNVTMEDMKLERTTAIEGSSNVDQPPYAEIQTEAPPHVSSKSEKLVEYLNQNTPPAGGYSEIELKPDDSKCAVAAKPPRHVSLLDPMSEEKEPKPTYQDIDQHSDPTSTTNVAQENDIYTEPDTTNSHIVDPDSGTYETVYSEPIQPSLFTDAVQTSNDSEDLQPYAPIYTIPVKLLISEKVLFKVSGSNIKEINELGMGNFGKVILAETVGLSAKDLRLSESDDDKSKSTLVAVKKLKSDAPSTTKEAFEKEVNFMSRLTDKNVIRILGVCYEDTPFIMMEYMEKGDLNQYLQKFKVHHTTDSEPQGQITTSTLVHMTTQIASAMKYLASHNFVHRDLATRNCLVGQNYLVKISDFGMSRSLYDSHYYRIHGRFALPVRWMAFECFYGKFSQKSDVWAFGVTMWEIFTLAKEQPYSDMSDKQVIEDALKGKNRQTLARPYMCPLEVYKIMLECWAHNSKQRATFEELFQLLTSIHIDE